MRGGHVSNIADKACLYEAFAMQPPAYKIY
jgi:hypothetical protein